MGILSAAAFSTNRRSDNSSERLGNETQLISHPEVWGAGGRGAAAEMWSSQPGVREALAAASLPDVPPCEDE